MSGVDTIDRPQQAPQEESEAREKVSTLSDEASSRDKLNILMSRAQSSASSIGNQLDVLATESTEVDLDPEKSSYEKLKGELDDEGARVASVLGLETEFDDGADLSVPIIEAENPTTRAVEMVQELQERAKLRKPGEPFPTVGMMGGADKIEGQQIDIVDQGDKTVVYFKTTSAMTEKIKQEIIPGLSPDEVTDGTFSFQFVDGQIENEGDAWVIKLDENTTISVAEGAVKGTYEEYDLDKPILNEQGEIIDYEMKTTIHIGHIRALIGSIKIEVQGITGPQEIADRVDFAFQKLQITDALVKPDQQAETQYKEARFRWQHRLESKKAWQAYKEKYKAEHGGELVDHLERQEVFPEYSTIVDQGASERYLQEGERLLLHTINDPETLVLMLQHGLLSINERFKQGIPVTGQSVDNDFQSGGADSVFLRALQAGGYDKTFLNRIHLLINPQVLDRTDWYAYNYDSYGTIEPSQFNLRPSPEQFFAEQRRISSQTNEIMMRRGIQPEMISGVMVDSEALKAQIVATLQEAGITEVNGVPIDQFVGMSPELEELKRQNGIANPKSDSSIKEKDHKANANTNSETQPIKPHTLYSTLYEDDEGD